MGLGSYDVLLLNQRPRFQFPATITAPFKSGRNAEKLALTAHIISGRQNYSGAPSTASCEAQLRLWEIQPPSYLVRTYLKHPFCNYYACGTEETLKLLLLPVTCGLPSREDQRYALRVALWKLRDRSFTEQKMPLPRACTVCKKHGSAAELLDVHQLIRAPGKGQISGVPHYGVPHNEIVVLARKTT